MLVIGGEAPPEDYVKSILPGYSYICAADSGLDKLIAWNMEPDLVVGDMDSVKNPSILSNYKNTKLYPIDKDYSDTELALMELIAMGFEYICLVGGGGGRLDHLLAIRALFERARGPDEWLSPGGRLLRIGKACNFSCRAGSIVSVFPLAFGAYSMKSKGLKWPLNGLAWNPGGFGLSNIAVNGRFYVDPGEKPVLIVLPLDSKGPF